MQDNKNTKVLAFVTITMRDPNERYSKPADFEALVVDEKTARKYDVGFDFRPDPRLGQDDFPIMAETANNLMGEAIHELTKGWVGRQEFHEHGSIHIPYGGFIQKLIEIAQQHLKDFSALPDPIDTPLGKITFVPAPTKENFKSLEELPTTVIPFVREKTGQIVPVYAVLTQSEVAVAITGGHYGYGGQRFDQGYDRGIVLQNLADQLEHVFGPYGLEVATGGNPVARPTFGGQRQEPPVEYSRLQYVQAAYREMASELLHLLGTPHGIAALPGFTLSRGGQIQRLEDAQGRLTLNLNLGGAFNFQILSGDYLRAHQRGMLNVENIVGTISFHDEQRVFTISQQGHHRLNGKIDLTKILEPADVKNLVAKAVSKELEPLGLDHLIDVNSIAFDSVDGK
jgi:hypothetical protein